MRRLLLLAALAIAIALSVHHTGVRSTAAASDFSDRIDDRELYRAIAERVRAGQGYYPAAAAELRKNHFPLKPALTFRLPTLAWLLALLPGTPSRLALLWTLTAVAALAFAASLGDLARGERIALTALAGSGLANAGAIGSVYLHESWSIVLVIGSLAFRRSTPACVALAAAALLIRETAAPYLLALGAVALLRRDYRRVAALAAVCLGFAVVWLVHAAQTSDVVLAGDAVSPGWLGYQGWPLVVSAARWNLLLHPLPREAVAAVLPAALTGLALWRSDLGLVCCLTVLTYAAGLMVLGRPDNAYWGIMLSPMLLLGLPALAKALFRPARPAPLPC